MEKSVKRTITFEDTKQITPHTKAIYEAGSNLLKESISTGREYCKSMITICLSAIPIYITLLQLYVPDKKTISDIINFNWLTPIIIYLFATILFLIGYLPGHSIIKLELPDTVESLLNKTVKRRFYLGISGFITLVIGIGYSIYIITTLSR
jgi:hypothetical protein